jgi:hypothetical protein
MAALLPGVHVDVLASPGDGPGVEVPEQATTATSARQPKNPRRSARMRDRARFTASAQRGVDANPFKATAATTAAWRRSDGAERCDRGGAVLAPRVRLLSRFSSMSLVQTAHRREAGRASHAEPA